MDFATVLQEFSKVIPELTFEAHKGQAGRIGVVGGSKNYTGAPYFAAISALKVGCDLSHVFCTQDASLAIKSYSPELMVHPVLDNADFDFSAIMSSLHSLVIGPGLGREDIVFRSVRRIVDFAKSRDLPLVFDADSLFYINSNLDVVSHYPKAILTPNKVEFQRLYKAVTKNCMEGKASARDVEEVSRCLGNVTIVCKGSEDIISDGVNTVICNESGSPRRCGGQGDLLSGVMGVFNYWSHRNVSLSVNPAIVAACGACMLTRRCSFLSFQKFKRSVMTSNMIDEIGHAFKAIFKCD